MKRIETVSKKSGIPMWKIMEALGRPLEEWPITTLAEAKDVYTLTLNDISLNNSRIQKKILLKWEELSLKESEAATTKQAAQAIYNLTPNGSKAERKALLKLNGLLLQEVEQATDPREIQLIYENTPVNGLARKRALLKLKEMLLQKVEKAATLEEAIELCRLARPIGGKVRRKAFAKRLELCSTTAEVRDAYLTVTTDVMAKGKAFAKWLTLCLTQEEAREAYNWALKDNELQDKAFLKWNSLSLRAVEKVTTVAGALDVYSLSPDNSESKGKALIKLIDLCSTQEEAREVYNFFSALGNEAHKSQALVKWEELSLRELAKAATAKEALAIRNLAKRGGAAEKTILLKWNNLLLQELERAVTLVEAKAVYESASYNSKAQKLAVKKIYELTPEE